jgi:hypothetical protein
LFPWRIFVERQAVGVCVRGEAVRRSNATQTPTACR